MNAQALVNCPPDPARLVVDDWRKDPKARARLRDQFRMYLDLVAAGMIPPPGPVGRPLSRREEETRRPARTDGQPLKPGQVIPADLAAIQ